MASFGSFAAYQFHESRTYTRLKLKYIRVESLPLIKLKGFPWVNNTKVSDTIDNAFNSRVGGIQVIYAPWGTGKTTSLAHVSQKHKDRKHVEFVSCVANKAQLYAWLGIHNETFQLSEVLPEGTVLVLDQMETPVWGPELKAMLRELALDSRKSKTYNIVLSVSNLEIAKKILALNGNDKIKLVARSSDFRWGRELVTAYVEESKRYKHWLEADKESLIKLATLAGAPEFMFSLEDEVNLTPALLNDVDIVAKAQAFAAAWECAAKAGL